LVIFEGIMKRSILPVLLILAFTGCKKENNKAADNLIPLKGTYQSSTTMEISAPVMYTQGSVITDRLFIDGYLARKKASADFEFESNIKTIPAGMFNMVIDKNSSGTVKIYLKDLFNQTINGSVINQSATDLLFQAYKPDTTILATGVTYGYTGTGPNIGKTKPVRSFVPLASGTGYQGILINLAQLRLLIKNNDLYLSELGYYYSFDNNNGIGYSASYIYDVINPNLSKELLPKDTVVVQQRLVKLLK
jgi:hypothetical protein